MENPFEMSSHSLDETDDAEEAHLQFLTRQLVQPSPLQPSNHDHLSSKTTLTTTSTTSTTLSTTTTIPPTTLPTSPTPPSTIISEKDSSQITKATTISNSNHIFTNSSLRFVVIRF